jgi:hypothetical protein
MNKKDTNRKGRSQITHIFRWHDDLKDQKNSYIW